MLGEGAEGWGLCRQRCTARRLAPGASPARMLPAPCSDGRGGAPLAGQPPAQQIPMRPSKPAVTPPSRAHLAPSCRCQGAHHQLCIQSGARGDRRRRPSGGRRRQRERGRPQRAVPRQRRRRLQSTGVVVAERGQVVAAAAQEARGQLGHGRPGRRCRRHGCRRRCCRGRRRLRSSPVGRTARVRSGVRVTPRGPGGGAEPRGGANRRV